MPFFDYMTKVNKIPEYVPIYPEETCNELRQIKKSFPNLIPHKVLNIRGYICTCLALFFIFDFIQLLKYQILQFHPSLFHDAWNEQLSFLSVDTK